MPPDALPLWKIVVPFAAFVSLAWLCRCDAFPLLRTVFTCCLFLIVYACIQDQCSARLCSEYFTIGHGHLPLPSWVETTPTALGLVWGFLAGFPGGIVLGIPIALTANTGYLDRVPVSDLKRPLLWLVAFMMLSTLVTGASANYNAQVVNIRVGAPWDTLIQPQKQHAFFVVACAHFGSYLSALIGGGVLCLWLIKTRRTTKTG